MQRAPSAPRTELTRLRREANLTQEELAAALGLRSARAVIAWERGDYAPSINYVLPLARLLGVSLQEVVEAIAGPDPGAAPDLPDVSFLRPDVRRLVEASFRASAPDATSSQEQPLLPPELREALRHHLAEVGRLIRHLQETAPSASRRDHRSRND